MDSRLEDQLSEPVKREWKKLQTNLEQASERHYQEQRLLMSSFMNDMLRIEKRRPKLHRAATGLTSGLLSSPFSSPTHADLETFGPQEYSAAQDQVIDEGRAQRRTKITEGDGSPVVDKLRCSKKQLMQGRLLDFLAEGNEFSQAEVEMEHEWLTELTQHVARQHEVLQKTRSKEWMRVKQIAMSDMELLLSPFRNFSNWLQELEEPHRAGRLAAVVSSKAFEVWVCLIVLLNCFTTWTLVNRALEGAATDQTEFGQTLAIVNMFFVLWYWIELSLKLCVHRNYFFCNEDWGWNLYDTFLVAASTVEIVITFWTDFKQSSQLSFARVARVFKVVRIFRVLRTVRFAMTPRLMLDCLLQSLTQVIWALILLCFMLYVFSLLLVQDLTNLLSNPGNDLKSTQVEELLNKFGSIEGGMLTLFMAVTGGESWSAQYNLLQPLGWASSVVYLVFVVIFTVIVWNMFTAIVVHRISELAAPDVAEELNDKQKRQLDMEDALMSAFTRIDADTSGSISLAEFAKALEDDEFRDAFKMTGLDLDDVVFLFDVLTTQLGHENVDIRDVVMGSMKLKGPSSSFDSFTVLQTVKKLSDDTHSFILFCMRRLQGITERLQVAEELTYRSADAVKTVQMDIASFSREMTV